MNKNIIVYDLGVIDYKEALNFQERKLQEIIDIKRAKKDLMENNLELEFQSIDELYIETRKEAINNAIASRIEI